MPSDMQINISLLSLCTTFKYSFFPSAITCWNDFPFDTTELSSPAKTHNTAVVSNYCFPCWFTFPFPLCMFFWPQESGLVLALVAISCRLCRTGTNLSLLKVAK